MRALRRVLIRVLVVSVVTALLFSVPTIGSRRASALRASPRGAPAGGGPSGEVVAWWDGQRPVPDDVHAVRAIAAGVYINVALRADGSVAEWDDLGATLDVPPAAQSGVTAVAAGDEFALALKVDGTVVGWGSSPAASVPVAVHDITAISAGWNHALALQSDGRVVAWGSNFSGQATVPTAAQSGVAAISAGSFHSLALKSDGTLVAWGDNAFNETTVPPSAQSNVKGIAAGHLFSVALRADGTVVEWGHGLTGETTIPVAARTGVMDIAAGNGQALALKADGTVVAWGKSGVTPPAGLRDVIAVAAGTGNLALVADSRTDAWGDGSGNATVPFAARSPRAIAAGGDHAVTLGRDGRVFAWGGNYWGQINVPPDLHDVIAVDAGSGFTLALRVDGTVAAWGVNNVHQSDVPAGLHDVVAIAAGYAHAVALKADGTLVAWGNNSSQETAVPAGLGNVVAIAAGQTHNIALKSDGTLATWGAASYGWPVPPAAQSRVVAVDAGCYHSLARLVDGTLVGWGDTQHGQGTVPASAQSNVVAMAAGEYHSLALRADGAVVAWGDGATIAPPGLSGVTALAAGGWDSFTLRTNRAPEVGALAATSSAEGDAGAIDVAASDPDGDQLTFGARNLPGGVTVNPFTGRLSGVPRYDSAGTYDVTVTASDGRRTGTSTFTWTVTNTLVPYVSVGHASVVEGDAGNARTVSFAVTLSEPGVTEVTVGYHVTTAATPTAIAPYDFQAKSGYVTFKPTATGRTPTTLVVTAKVMPDRIVEGTETFGVLLTGVSGTDATGASFVFGGSLPGLGGAASATATIIDDDPGSGPRVSVGDAVTFEGDVAATATATNAATVWVNLAEPATSTLSVQVSVAGGSATAGTDFPKAFTRTVTFQARQYQASVRVPVRPDLAREGDESVLATLSNPSSGLTVVRPVGVITIRNDD